MTELATQYGKVLYELGLSSSVLEQTKEILEDNRPLLEALDNPSIKAAEKHNVIDKLFDHSAAGFVKVVTDHHMISQIADIFEAYEDYEIEQKNWVKAVLYYVTKPEETQIEGIKEKVKKEYQADGVSLKLVKQPSLMGGFVLKVRDFETDRSVKGRLEQLTKNLVRR